MLYRYFNMKHDTTAAAYIVQRTKYRCGAKSCLVLFRRSVSKGKKKEVIFYSRVIGGLWS